jgi:hypothetical protein
MFCVLDGVYMHPVEWKEMCVLGRLASESRADV